MPQRQHLAPDKIADLLFGMVELTPAVHCRIADQQQLSSIVNRRHLASQISHEGLVQAFDQVHSSSKEFIMR